MRRQSHVSRELSYLAIDTLQIIVGAAQIVAMARGRVPISHLSFRQGKPLAEYVTVCFPPLPGNLSPRAHVIIDLHDVIVIYESWKGVNR
ncbi:MAG: hypothetical protein ABI831_20300 [Betaproteobacteria bacterium]